MKKYRIEYNQKRKFSPISIWVHKSISDDKVEWRNSEEYKPPFPDKVVLKGFPYLVVLVGNVELEFSSSYEVEHCINVLNQKNLPSTKDMVCSSSTTYTGYNHWLASYPAGLKSWKQRQKTVRIIAQSLAEVTSSGINF